MRALTETGKTGRGTGSELRDQKLIFFNKNISSFTLFFHFLLEYKVFTMLLVSAAQQGESVIQICTLF